jgi:hypothetical protein
MADYLTRTDLDRVAKAATVDQLFDDDGDGMCTSTSELETLDQYLDLAEDHAYSFLLRAFSREEVTNMGTDGSTEDAIFRHHVAWVALAFAAERPREFVSETGAGRYQAQLDRAEKYFERMAKGQLHTKSARSGQTGGEVRPKESGVNVPFVFAPTPANPRGTGGF